MKNAKTVQLLSQTQI